MVSHPLNRFAPISFNEDVQKLTKHFTKPQEIFYVINQWLEERNERFFILAGKPCTGKSAIAAYLAQTHQNIAAYHLCIARRSNTVDPNCIFLSLAAQFIKNIPGYAEALVNTITPLHLSVNVSIDIDTIQDSQVTGVVIEHLNTDNPQETLDIILRRPFSAMSNQDQRPLLILFDALNEAIRFESHDNLVTLLANAIDLSPRIRFLCTTRSDKRIWSLLKSSEICHYEIKDQSITISQYINLRLKNNIEEKNIDSHESYEVFVNQLVEKAQGNFLYTKFILDEIESKNLFVDHLNSLPVGLNQIYHELVHGFIEGSSRDTLKSILGILTVAREPLSQQQISQFTSIELEEVRWKIRLIYQLLDALIIDGEEKYTLFHESFRDYLVDAENNSDFWCAASSQHRRIANFYWADDGEPWEQNLTNNDYLWKYLPYHLGQANQHKRLQSLLLNFAWLQAKIDVTNIHSLIADFRLVSSDQDLALVEQALRLSVCTLEQDTHQLASQLVGRLISCKTETLNYFIEHIDCQAKFVWFRCLTASLTPPGGALAGIFLGHTSYVTAIALVPGEKQVVSASRDGTLRLWDIDSGRCLKLLEGHKDLVTGVVVTFSGYYAISVSNDRTVKQWDLRSGKFQNILGQCSSNITAMATLPDSDQVVLALDNYEVGLWDVASQQYRKFLQIPNKIVTSIAVSSNRNFIVFGLDDYTFQLWDWNLQLYRRTVIAHDGLITALAFTLDENQVVSASLDSKLKVWNLVD